MDAIVRTGSAASVTDYASILLSLVLLTALVLLLYVGIRSRQMMRRLGWVIIAAVPLIFWTGQAIARFFYGYAGPSVLVTRIATIRDGVMAMTALAMSVAFYLDYRDRKKAEDDAFE